MPPELAEAAYKIGRRPGYSVTKLNGEFSGLRRPQDAIARRIPFSRLPACLLDPDDPAWCDVSAGRWRYVDHITLGEARTVVKFVRLPRANPLAHREK